MACCELPNKEMQKSNAGTLRHAAAVGAWLQFLCNAHKGKIDFAVMATKRNSAQSAAIMGGMYICLSSV